MSDPLINKQFVKTFATGAKATYRIIRVDRTCYEPSHSPDNPWIEAIDIHDSTSKSIGCFKTIVPQDQLQNLV